jgi:hypothetical protein
MGYLMEYEVYLRRSVEKAVERMPPDVQESFKALVELLRIKGPTGPYIWHNYGKLRNSRYRYHCHLTANHAYVACWEWKKDVLIVEVYYAGSHKDAPY